MAKAPTPPGSRFYELRGEDGRTPVLVATLEDLHERVMRGDVTAVDDMMTTVGRAFLTPLKLSKLPGKRVVSTIFLAHAVGLAEPPRLFETIMFGPSRKVLLGRRYVTWDEAMSDHDRIVADPDAALADERRRDQAMDRFFAALLTGNPKAWDGDA